MSVCGEHSLVADGVAVTLRCERWTCDHCLPVKRAELGRKASAGDATHLLTLTVNPARYLNSADGRTEAAADLQEAWRKVRRIAARRGLRLPFLAVFEENGGGWPHLHILLRTEGFLSHRWLSSQMARLISAPVIHIRRARLSDCEYLAKAPVRFPGRKRHWNSLDWPLVRVAGFARQIWLRVPASLDTIQRQLRSLGWAHRRWPNRLEWPPP